MQVNIAPDAIVVRFAPVQPEAVLNKAAQEHRRIQRHWVSVFAAEAGQGESDEAVAARLLQASELGGIDPARNPKYYTCRAQELLDRVLLLEVRRGTGQVEGTAGALLS